MFTGLVQDVGRVVSMARSGQGAKITLETVLAPKLAPGDSLAVNGTCLTVVPAGQGRVSATAIAETLDRTTLGGLSSGARVNLEPALAAGTPLGGHLVQGHVDGVAQVARIEARGDSREVTLSVEAALARYVAHKGSVALDGVSLTVARLRDEAGGARSDFTVALVPHTLKETTFGEVSVGQKMNIEVDIVAKYVERLLGFMRRDEGDDGGGYGGHGGGGSGGGGVTRELLERNGFA